jgi:hypothetical protein
LKEGFELAETILEEFFGGLWDSYFDWYSQRIFEGISPQNIAQLLVAVIVIYVLLLLLGAVFPFIGRLLNILFLPFTVLHVWMHVRAMQHIKTREDPSQPGPYAGSAIMGSSLGVGILRDEWSSVRIVTDNPRTARKVAFAPTKLFMPLFLLVMVSSPFLQLFFADHRLSVLIHMYLLLGCLRGLPNAEDQYFVYYSIMMNATFSPNYLLYLLPLFVLSTALQYAAGGDEVSAIVMGVAYTYLYFILLLLLATRYALRYEAKSESAATSSWEQEIVSDNSEDASAREFLILGYD